MAVQAEHVKGDRYRVRLSFGTDPATGRTIQRSRYFRAPSKRKANEMAVDELKALKATKDRGRALQGTVAQAVDLWVKHRAPLDSPATIYRRRSIVATIVRDLGHIRLDDLSPLQIDQWYAGLRAENVGQGTTRQVRSEATIHHYHRVLSAILQQSWKWGMTERLPAKRATAPKNRRVRPKAPPPATVQLLIQAAPPTLAVAAHLLAATGLRRGELAALRWTDLDLDEGTVNVVKAIAAPTVAELVVKAPKNEESIRKVSIDPDTCVVLERHGRAMRHDMPDLADDAYLFPDPVGPDRTGRTPRSPDWITRGWRRLCAQHGAKVRIHDLRHFSVTTLLAAGVPVNAVAGRHGHSKPSTTTDIYGDVIAGQDLAAAAIMQKALSAS